MKKCEYCAKEITYFEQYCSDDCQVKANKYFEKSDKLGKFFSIINVICVFGIPVGLFLLPFEKLIGTGVSVVSCIILGLLIIILPFPTESMITKLKLEKAIKYTRFIGAGVIALGFVIMGILFFVF